MCKEEPCFHSVLVGGFSDVRKMNPFAPGKAWERGKRKRRNVVLGNLSS
jgi:hypothetical protein